MPCSIAPSRIQAKQSRAAASVLREGGGLDAAGSCWKLSEDENKFRLWQGQDEAGHDVGNGSSSARGHDVCAASARRRGRLARGAAIVAQSAQECSKLLVL
jgi:hypothetical protein